jgi:hypothetical protein
MTLNEHNGWIANVSTVRADDKVTRRDVAVVFDRVSIDADHFELGDRRSEAVGRAVREGASGYVAASCFAICLSECAHAAVDCTHSH